MHSKKAAYTLIEVLLVIAIIGILAAIAIVLIQPTRIVDEASENIGSAQIEILRSAILNYQLENDQELPPTIIKGEDPYTFGSEICAEEAEDCTGYTNLQLLIGTQDLRSLPVNPMKPTSNVNGTGYCIVKDRHNNVDIYNCPSQLQLMATPDLVGSLSASDAADVKVTRDYAFIADNSGSGGEVEVVDISDVSSPQKISGAVTGSGAINAIDIDGRYLFVANAEDDGLQIFDVINPAQPTEQINPDIFTEDDIESVFVEGDITVAAAGSTGAYIVNTKFPLAASQHSLITDDEDIMDAVIKGNIVYILKDSADLDSYNISNPASPGDLDSFTESGSGIKVIVEGNYAHMISSSNGYTIVNVSNPSNMTETGFLAYSTNPTGIDVRGEHAFITSADGLDVIDISDPSSPEIITSYTGAGDFKAVDVFEKYAFIANGSSGLAIVQIFE